MVIYGIYNSETTEKVINMMHHLHNKATCNANLFVGKLNQWYQWYLYEEGAVHYAIKSIL